MHVQGGTVWEKAGVNVSVVYGSMPAEAYRAATAQQNGSGEASCQQALRCASQRSSPCHHVSCMYSRKGRRAGH